jgi:hypothetical protein
MCSFHVLIPFRNAFFLLFVEIAQRAWRAVHQLAEGCTMPCSLVTAACLVWLESCSMQMFINRGYVTLKALRRYEQFFLIRNCLPVCPSSVCEVMDKAREAEVKALSKEPTMFMDTHEPV